MTQNERIKEHLEKYGKITALEAMNEYGIMRLASRIAELKRDGMNITTNRMHVKNRYGEEISCAIYELQ